MNWNLNVDWRQRCFLSLKPHSPSQNFLPLVTVIGLSVPIGAAQVLKSSSGDDHCPWMIVMVALLANPPSAKAGSCHAEEVNQRAQ